MALWALARLQHQAAAHGPLAAACGGPLGAQLAVLGPQVGAPLRNRGSGCHCYVYSVSCCVGVESMERARACSGAVGAAAWQPPSRRPRFSRRVWSSG